MDLEFQSHLELSRKLFAQGQWDHVEHLSREALRNGKMHPLYFALIAVSHAMRGNVKASEKLLQVLCTTLGTKALNDTERILRDILEPELVEAILRGLLRTMETGAQEDVDSDLGAWPYMGEFEVKAMLAALRVPAQPLRVLEWGSGRSSFYFSRKLPPQSTWNSIEHDRNWFATLEAAPRPSGGAMLHLDLVPNSRPFQDGLDDGDLETFRDYVERPLSLGSGFGFILVDGRARVECLKLGWRLLAPDGLMVLHDAERPEYRPGHPRDAFSLEIRNPGLNEPKAVFFFAKSWDTYQALVRDLRKVLPAYVNMISAMPRAD